MFCKKCGKQNSDNAEFCTSCGASMATGQQNSGYQAPPPGYQTNPGMGSQTGLQKNVSGLLCYLFGWITGIIFYFIDKDPFVRFHAIQSIIVSVIITVISILLQVLLGAFLWRVWFLYTILNLILWVVTVGVWVLCMVKAYHNEKFKLPIIGDIAEKYAH